jgi:outer membrane protein TolC
MMTISGRRQIPTLTFVLALVAHPVLAQDAADRVRFERIAREAAQKVDLARADAAAQAQAAQAAQAGAPLPQVPTGPLVELPLDDAVQRALERNLDISVERLDPQAFDFTIAALDANYRPTFTSSFGLRSQSQFPRSQTAGADMLVTDTLTGNAGLTQNLKWGGGSFAVTFNNNRQEQSDAFATRNPAINTNLSATFVQPLLRSFRIDGTRAQLQITRLNQQISEIALRSTIVRTLAEVRSAYWDLIFAIDAVKVAESSLDLATKLVEDNRARVEVGTLAKLDVVQAQAEEATRRQALTQAIANRRTAELQLKRLIVSGTDDPYWSARLEPVERPSYSTQPVDVAQAIRTALGTRTDLEQARRQISANDIALRSWTDQQLPALDLTASYGLAGVGGTQFIRTGLGGQIASTIPSGYADALSILARQDAPTWNINLNFSFPIGASPAEANVARARLQQRQTLAQTKQLELQIATEVSNAATQVDFGLARLDAANVALDLMQQRLEYEQSRYDVGLSTNYQVVQAQRDLRDAQNAQLRALLDYRQAQVDFERVQQIPLGGGGAITAIGASGSQPPRAGGGF